MSFARFAFVRSLLRLAIVVALALPVAASAQTAWTVTNLTDTNFGTLETGGGFGPGNGSGNSGDLRYVLFQATATTGANTITFPGCTLANPCQITLSAPLPPIYNTGNLGSQYSLIIDGGVQGAVILDGNSLGKNTTAGALTTNRVFFVDSLRVTFKNLVIQNATAQGGNAASGGGGGAGFGAGLFVNQAGAIVTLQNVSFLNCSVIGGSGGSGSIGGGGGGMAFGGAVSGVPATGGGGGVSGAGSASSGGPGGGGGPEGGPGGVAYAGNNAGSAGSSTAAGAGDFGGGGGGSNNAGGNGGFGGGGGAGYVNGGGNGGFGGGGGASDYGSPGTSAASVGGVHGGSAFYSGGGGGAAAGPAIFVAYGSVILYNTTGSSFSATPGAGGFNAAAGTASATPVFNYGGTVNGSSSVGPVYNAFTVTEPVGQSSATQTATLTFTTASTTSTAFSINGLTQGAPNLDFQIAKTQGSLSTDCASGKAYAAGAACTVQYTFKPAYPGLRLGGITVTDNSGNLYASTLISGVGTGPLALFQAGVLSTTYSTNLSEPRGLSTDGFGNLYVANSTANTVLKFAPGSTTPTVFTASGTTAGTAVDGAGNLYYSIANGGARNVFEIVGATGVTAPIAVILTMPDDNLSVDLAGNLYLSDQGGAIYEIAAGTRTVSTLLQAGGFSRFVGMALDNNGNLFAAGFNNNTLYELPAGSTSPIALYGGSPLKGPDAVAVDAAGNVYVANLNDTNLYRFAAGNYRVTPVTLPITAQKALAVDAAGMVYSAPNETTLLAITRSGNPPLSFARTNVGSISASQTVTLENDGNSALTFPAPQTGGSNPSQSNYFTLSNSSTCPLVYSGSATGTLAAGATCTETISYTPTINGAVTGNLIFTDNNLNASSATQTVVMTGSSMSTLTVSVVGQTVPSGTASITLEFTVGWGGNTAPTGTPTLTVNGSSANVGTIACTAKAGHNNCTVSYNPSSLSPGNYTITATEGVDSNYTTATSGSGILTVTGTAQHTVRPVKGGPVTISKPGSLLQP